MDFTSISKLLDYAIPTLITGGIAYYFFSEHVKSESQKMKYELLKRTSKQSLPIKLQAYERMTLFLERIKPNNLVSRLQAANDNKFAYGQSLINTIEQEFEHNLTQQIYISEQCWSIISASKNETIQLIQKAIENEKNKSIEDLKSNLLKNQLNTPAPSIAALSFLKEEVTKFI